MNLPDLNKARSRQEDFGFKEYKFNPEFKDLGKNKHYFLRTYGCQMNEHDSENIKGLLEQIGYTETDDLDNADLVILNTCSIRENAHNKAFGMLGRIKHLKEKTNKNIVTAICGCMAQEPVVCEEIKSKYKFVNFVFGTHNIYELPELINDAEKINKTNFQVYSYVGDVIEDIPVVRDSKYKAWVNIQFGCDKFCTYCIVPYTRGKQRSRKMNEILEECKDLKEQGYQEITLLGQNVNAYGKDLDEGKTLADLLKEVAKLGIPRIRFVTSHPWDFTDEMIEIIKEYDNIMPYIHLPLQSGSSRILKLMNRRYTSESYKELFDKIKEIPNVTVTTDIIVGFPGETEEDFQETLDMVNYCKYDGAYTFIFSPRVGTPGEKLEEEMGVPQDIKEERLQRLNEIVNKYYLESNQKMLNREELVLVDGLSTKENELCGYTENNKLVNFNGSEDLIGKIVKVKITDAKSFSLDGELSE